LLQPGDDASSSFFFGEISAALEESLVIVPSAVASILPINYTSELHAASILHHVTFFVV